MKYEVGCGALLFLLEELNCPRHLIQIQVERFCRGLQVSGSVKQACNDRITAFYFLWCFFIKWRWASNSGGQWRK
jgi:hypothetical protein